VDFSGSFAGGKVEGDGASKDSQASPTSEHELFDGRRGSMKS